MTQLAFPLARRSEDLQPAPVSRTAEAARRFRGTPATEDQTVRAASVSPLARNTDPISSHLAAKEHRSSGRHLRQCEAVLAAVVAHPGSTSAELAADFCLDRYVVARRLSDLAHKGLVSDPKGADVVIRDCRVSGRKAVTWWLR